MNINNNLVLLVVVFCLGGICGYLGYSFLGPMVENVQIKYVAEEEIMDLERARLEKENMALDKKNLFFGDVDRAVSLTMKIAATYNDRTTRVIFSLSPVFADGVESISKEVHEEVIKMMQENVVERNNK